MKALIAAALASVALSFPAAAEEETDPAFIGGAVVDMLDAHGVKGGRFASTAEYDGKFKGVVIKGLAAGGPAGIAVSADTLAIGGINEPNGDGAQWLGISRVAATNVTLRTPWFTVKVPELDVSDVELQNSVTDTEAKANGYEFIDGAFSAVKVSAVKASGASVMSPAGKALADNLDVAFAPSEWLPSATFPAKVSLTVSGFATPEGLRPLRAAGAPTGAADAAEEFALVGNYGVSKSIGLGTAVMSLRTATLGAASAKVDLGGLKSAKVASIAVNASNVGENGLPKLLEGVSLSSVIAAGEGLGWIRGATGFDQATFEAMLSRALVPSAAKALSELADAVLTDGKSIARIEPKSRLPLSGIVAGTKEPVAEAIAVTR